MMESADRKQTPCSRIKPILKSPDERFHCEVAKKDNDVVVRFDVILSVMDAHIIRMAKVLGIPWESPKWKAGDAWFDDPALFRMFSRIASVMEYVEAEFGIQGEAERTKLHQFLRDLHSAFCHRLARGEKLETITFPPEALEDYQAGFGGRFPAAVLVEKLRKQFDGT